MRLKKFTKASEALLPASINSEPAPVQSNVMAPGPILPCIVNSTCRLWNTSEQGICQEQKPNEDAKKLTQTTNH